MMSSDIKSQREYPAKDSNVLRVVFLGDVVGRPGRAALKEHLFNLKESTSTDLVLVNGENAAGGAGIDPGTAREIKAAGVDVITLGDHSFQRKGSSEFINENSSWLIRPANLPIDTTPGKGDCVLTLADGLRVCVINLLGRVFISGTQDCPFRAVDSWLARIKSDSQVITICDFHAEATSEKYAMARHVDGRVSLLVGTHTHVKTADAQVLPAGTGYITDLGMTGNQGGVIGMKSEVALHRFLSPRPAPYEVAEGQGCLSGILADINRKTKKAEGVYLV
jgi:metallophosphoesterase (TIGR00282 family)